MSEARLHKQFASEPAAKLTASVRSPSRPFRLIICTHDLSVQPPATATNRDYWLPFDEFRTLYDELAVNTRSAGLDLELTSDDAFVSDYENLLPWLLDHHLRATFFVPTAFLGAKGRLTAAHLREMQALGMRIGSHGADHIDWARASPPELHRDVETGLKQLEDILGTPIRAVAPPFGAYDCHVVRLLRKHGFDEIHTCRGGFSQARGLLRNRVSVRRDPVARDRLVRLSGRSPSQRDWLRSLVHAAQARLDPRTH